MIEPINKTNCCGCGACVQICPRGALRLQPDEDGFVYPQLDEKACIHCNLCEKACLFQAKRHFPSHMEVFAAHAEHCDLTKSASGGLFAGFATAFLREGGLVCGCAMEQRAEGLTASHILISDEKDLPALLGSKYVQSNASDCYPEIRAVLDGGNRVLFCGTPCQVAGLHGFLRKEYDRLFCLDLVCHGVPNQHFFRSYLSYQEQKNGYKIREFFFRDKSLGWKLHGRMLVEETNGAEREVFFEPEESSYYQMFLNGYPYRENCYTCPYVGENRPGDISLGDFWGIELVHPELMKENGGPIDAKKGVSCMIINSLRGDELLRNTPDIAVYPSSFENASRYNRQLIQPTLLKPERETILRLARGGYGSVESWYQRRLFHVRVRRSIRKAIPKWAKSLAKRTMNRMRG